MKVHLSDQDYCALFILVLGGAEVVIDLQDRAGRILARCADHPIRLGLAEVVQYGEDTFGFSLTQRGHEATQTDHALAWFRKECDATRAPDPRSAEIANIR